MVRIVKDADVRRDELLDTALALFLENGYERTSVEHITQTVGVAKGTFYHYFATKQDLLEQLVERFTDELFVEAEKAMNACGGTALDRLRALFRASSSVKLGRKDETLMITRSLYSEENRALLSRLVEGWIVRTRPFILGIMEQGRAEGVFDVPDPAAMTEIWLSLWYDFGIRLSLIFFETQDDHGRIERLISTTKTFELVQERMLALPPGSLDMNVEAALRAVLSKD
jgi:AcrR family transcriptional regulator